MLKRRTESDIETLKYQSIFIVYKKAKAKGFKTVDLHYLFLDEAFETLYIIINAIRNLVVEQTKSGHFKLEIITGKGRHSRGDAVLFPKIMDWLKTTEHSAKGGEGRIYANIKI